MPTTRLKMRRRNEKGDLKKRPITMPERPKRLDRLLDPVMDNDGTANVPLLMFIDQIGA